MKELLFIIALIAVCILAAFCVARYVQREDATNLSKMHVVIGKNVIRPEYVQCVGFESNRVSILTTSNAIISFNAFDEPCEQGTLTDQEVATIVASQVFGTVIQPPTKEESAK